MGQSFVSKHRPEVQNGNRRFKTTKIWKIDINVQ